MSSKVRVYIKPFDDFGNYQDDWIDVTDDVDFGSMGAITQDLDNADYQIGVYRTSNISLKLNNYNGYYSDVGADRSIFKYKRSDSLVKITWEIEEDGPICGWAVCGEAILSEEMTLFQGLLDDRSATFSLEKQDITFQVLGRESIFERVLVPSSVATSNTFTTAIYKCLNQTKITDILTVSSSNISVGVNKAIGSIDDLQEKTVKEALSTILLLSNSVLYIDGDTIYVKARTDTSVYYTFYGQASKSGIENIVNIQNLKSGLSRTFNYFKWTDTSAVAADSTSLSKYGVFKKEISSSVISNTGDQEDIMNSLLTEFGNPKQELEMTVPLDYRNIDIKLLDGALIEYPTVHIPSDHEFPICGVAICGEAILPRAQWAFTIESDTIFKVVGKATDLKSSTIKLKLRET